MNAPRLDISPRMREFLSYPRFAGAARRVLILETDYFFDKSWERAAAELGWQTRRVPSAMTGEITRAQLEALFVALVEFKPDFILTSNYSGMDAQGIFARFFEDARIPYVSWFTDTPRMILYARDIHPSPYSVVATWERAYTGHFVALGFPHILYMPLATDPILFDAAPADTFDRPLAFVGSSMTEQAEQAWTALKEAPDIAEAVRAALDAGRVTRRTFAEGIAPLLGHELLRGRHPRVIRHAELCLLYEATRRERRAMVQRLEPLGIEVRGDPHWRGIVSRAAGGVGYYDHLAGFYRRTAVNLNVTSLQMSTAVNQRVFDCPAAGGFLITDAQADLEELFDPGAEVVTYASLDELEDKTRYYLAHPEERRAVTLRARERVRAQHTHKHRLEALDAYLTPLFAE